MLTPPKWLEDTKLQANLSFTNWASETHSTALEI